MIAIPILLLITATVGVGLYMGLRYLRRQRNRPTIIGLHFLLGAFSLEPMVVTMRGGLGHPAEKLSPLAIAAAVFVALALFSGVTAVMIGRQSRQTANIALASHAGLAAAAFALVMTWGVGALIR